MTKDKNTGDEVSQLRKRAETELGGRPDDTEDLSPEAKDHLLHELRVHQIELEMQNEELRRSQLELQAARDKYSDLYDFAPVGYFSINEKGMISAANLTGSTMLGVERGSLMGKPFSRFITVDDQDLYYHHGKRLFETKAPRSCELRLKRRDGSEFWAQLQCIVVRDSEGGFDRIQTAVIDIHERKRAEEQIKSSLKEKEVLLREIHHRTKNNMQVMISLLKIQAENIEDKQVAEMFKKSRDRIKSMALVHEKLYQSKGLADVDFKGYVKSLVNSIFSSYGASAAGITSITETDDVSIGLETAIPCGLIINELVSNSLKYAFPGNRIGEISIALRSFDEDALVLEVGDNGIGMPEDLDFRNTASMGLHLVNILSEDQLHGKIELDRAGGTTFRIRFKNHKYAARI